jgi:ribose transport system substrate-binding protein
MARTGPARARIAVICAVMATAIGVSACSSSSQEAGSGGNSSGSAVAKSSGASSGDVSAAQAIVDNFSKTPTSIPLTTPLKSKPPSQVTVVWMQCKLPQCIQIGQGVGPAAKALGWNLKVISYDSANPANLVSGMQQALQYRPSAVINSGLPEATWASVLPAYKAANVPIITSDIGPQVVGFPVIANLYGTADTENNAQAIGNWFIADSGGNGKALLVDVPSFPVLHAFSESFKNVVSRGCGGCTVSTLSATIPDVEGGQLNAEITSALRKDPSIKYLVVCDAAFIDTLPSSMSAAGLSGTVKIAGAWGDKVTEGYLATGQMQAFTGFATEYQGWQAIDAAARYLEGAPGTVLSDPSDGGLPIQLLTKDSLQTPSDSYNYPSNFADEFLKLWHVSS